MWHISKVGWIGGLITLVCLSSLGCGEKENIQFSMETGPASIIIAAPSLAAPLELGGDEGLLYFETESGRQWIQGVPTEMKRSGRNFHASWRIGNRDVSIDIRPQRGRINRLGGRQLRLTFQAEPGDGILGWGFAFNATSEEYYTGLFERTIDGHQSKSWEEGIAVGMDLRGETVEMIIKPTLSLYSPFYISSRGYGLFIEGSWPGQYDFAKTDSQRVQIDFEGPELQAILYIASEPAPIVQAHALRVGPTILPPRWVFEPWRWRNDHYNLETYFDGTPVDAPYNSMVVEDILMMKALDIPCSVYWVDRPWAVGAYGYDDFTWDRERLPDPEAMIKWIHGKGIKFLLWIAPWIMGDMAQEALTKGYFLPSRRMVIAGLINTQQANDPTFLEKEFKPAAIEMIEQLERGEIEDLIEDFLGEELDVGDPEAVDEARLALRTIVEEAVTLEELQHVLLMLVEGRILVDFTHPEARRWWQEKGIRKLLGDGVDGFKLDRSEQIVPETGQVVSSDGRTARELRNDYPVEYLKATYEITQETLGQDIVLLPRAGYTDSPKYGIFWGGDIYPPAEGLRAAIIAQSRCAIIGYPLWGSDTGGYDDPDDREVVARWLAFSCFSPIMEVGPTASRGLWDAPWEPSYDTELIAIWRMYATIHSRLADYTYDLAAEAQRTGMPVVRPLFLEYPHQEKAWADWQTYTFGPDLLVSPIWQKGKSQHSLFLPAGNRWVNAWNPDEVLEGGQTVTVAVPIHQIPIFIREDAEIELGDLNDLYVESLALAEKRPDMKTLEKSEFNTHE